MDRAKGTLPCENCGRSFAYQLLHAGFSDSAYTYCGECGMTAVLGASNTAQPPVRVSWFKAISTEAAAYLLRCPCGGAFVRHGVPRCPSCTGAWSADRVTDVFEADAPGAAKGWRWQRSWNGLYYVIIEGRAVYDIWRR